MSNWLTGIIVLLIIIILADGFRRTYSARQNRLGVSPSLNKRAKESKNDVTDLSDSYSSELPNGGARVVGHRNPKNKQSAALKKKLSGKEARELRRREEAAKRTPEQTHLDLEKSVPILMESVESKTAFKEVETKHVSHERIEPTFSSGLSEEDEHFESHAVHEDDDYEEHDNDVHEEIYEEEEFDEDDYQDEFEDDELEEDYEEVDEQIGQGQPEEVFIINVMAAKNKFFNGNDLLDATLKCGLRYGNMDIFHRYSTTKGEGVLLFSMANMVKPGTFDLDAMDDFETPGVSLFMTLPINADSMKSFDLMVDTANVLVEALDGELKDEQRSAMTRQTIEHCRQRISDFERKKLFRRSR